MEYIVVRFRDSRDVFVDGQQMGKTDETLRVEAGRHTVDLGEPENYTPKWRRPVIQDTTSLCPLEVTFEPE
ncbi:MAG TPA: hypothetical protein VIC28_09005 [Thermoanaerobaculia bacterium]|jgi:hypothetical protein